MAKITTVLISKDTRTLINKLHANYINKFPEKKRPSDDMVLNYFLTEALNNE